MTQQSHENPIPIDPITAAILRADLLTVIQLVGSQNVSEVLPGGQTPFSCAVQAWRESHDQNKPQYQGIVAYLVRLNPQVLGIATIAQDQELQRLVTS